MRPPAIRGWVGDLFAGGGGASEGIRLGMGRDPDFAVNHDPEAIAMHAANHPGTRHMCGDVWHANPRDVTGGAPVDFMWFSPTCTHFSRAKGGPLKDAKIRALAWVVVRWAREVRPKAWALENVTELQTWGRLLPDGTIDPRFVGHTFKTWLGKLKALGYQVEMREMRACDYGAPTTRKRLFIVGRCDGEPIAWPTPTHGPGLRPYRSAAECIDWSTPARSIFDRPKPLAEPTLRRIARALHVHVLDGRPFIVPQLGVAATMVQTGYGERDGQVPRALDIRAPLGTVVAGAGKHAVVLAVLVKHFGGPSNGGAGVSLRDPMATITCQDHHALVTAVASRTVDPRRAQQVRALLSMGDGNASGQLRLGGGAVVHVGGETYEIADVQMRMLEPRELYAAQSFRSDYVIDPVVGGKPLSKTAQIRMCGNSVAPVMAAAIVAANVGTRRSEEAA